MINGISGINSYGGQYSAGMPSVSASSQPPYMSAMSAQAQRLHMPGGDSPKVSFFGKIKNYFKNVGKAIIGIREKQPPVIITQPMPPVAKPAENSQLAEPDEELANWGDFGQEKPKAAQVANGNIKQDGLSEAYMDILKEMQAQQKEQQSLFDAVKQKTSGGSLGGLGDIQALMGNSERLEYNERPIF